MNAPSPAEQYRKQQEEADRQREMLEKAKGFPFIGALLSHLFGSNKQ